MLGVWIDPVTAQVMMTFRELMVSVLPGGVKKLMSRWSQSQSRQNRDDVQPVGAGSSRATGRTTRTMPVTIGFGSPFPLVRDGLCS